MGQIIELPHRRRPRAEPYLVVGANADRDAYIRVISALLAEYEQAPRDVGAQLMVAAVHLYGTSLRGADELGCAVERLAQIIRRTCGNDPHPPRAA